MSGFHPMVGLTEQELRQRPNSREFKGDGTPYLRVEGLKRLAPGDGAVRVGTLELPEKLRNRVPLDPNHTEFETVTEPLVVMQHAPDGTPVLLRNTQSNDGMWQAGISVYVDGEWEQPEPEAPGEQEGSFSAVQGAQDGKAAQDEREKAAAAKEAAADRKSGAAGARA